MTTRGGTLHAPAGVRVDDGERPPTRLPLVVYVLTLGTFLMGTTEFVVAGLLITVFAVGMIVGAPLTAAGVRT
ncbi:hypothetical protein ACOT81_44740 [Streptomyces sp. WI04-05B]|uniref:hypothetical protein n=1 Tax=Streptomyces TaxID=1883 RepID=UPI000A38F3DB|nr:MULTISPECIES: hypothetical protein [Streptomyces]MDX2548644.1 hypothetical protein [Streptomyces sp. WI04-05B]MDX2589035.1 hypothetical protein [Streptomyces sp. WI04-05A]MDX3313867.1 hypothetical protein [Streptomyces sp. ME08-AFT2]MDX3632488.1 hypothetical protein [Streptomyces europaeiscabiei]MDX3646771.1 hypothetical protein [Streptomyces europaeiscabiei]